MSARYYVESMLLEVLPEAASYVHLLSFDNLVDWLFAEDAEPVEFMSL